MGIKSAYKRENSLEKRAAEATWIREKNPNKLPVIVDKHVKSDVPDLTKKKFLVAGDASVGTFVYSIRRRMKLSADKAIFVFVNNVLPSTGALMSEIYKQHKDEDGILYMTYSGENTFGSP